MFVSTVKGGSFPISVLGHGGEGGKKGVNEAGSPGGQEQGKICRKGKRKRSLGG